MFFTTSDEYCISLHFQNEFMSLSCCPEYPGAINSSKKNKFVCRPCNGEFSFNWNDEKITFTCGKYGDGQGGNLTISFKVTPEILISLDKCIEEIKTFVEQHKDL